MSEITTPLIDLQQSVGVLERQIREIATMEVDAEASVNPHAPWANGTCDSAQAGEIKAALRLLEIERRAYAKACMLSGVGESLAVLFQERIESMIRDLGPLAEWDGSEVGLQLMLDASTPDHDSGDARAKRQFVRDTVPVLREAGVSTSEIAEIAARRSMRPRLAAAVSSVQKAGDLDENEKTERIRQAAEDARTETARAFDESWKARRIEILLYDEARLSPALWRRTYMLSNAQRDMLISMLRGREMGANMPLERRPSLALARECIERGDARRLYLSLLPTTALEVYETLDRWGDCDLETLQGAVLSDAGMGTVEGAISVLIEYGLIKRSGDRYAILKDEGKDK